MDEAPLEENIIIREAEDTVALVRNLVVTDRVSYETMANGVLLLRKSVKYFEELYRPRIKQATAVADALRADMRKLQQPAIEAQQYGDKQLSDYDSEQERIAQVEQLRLQAEQKRRDDEEREQLAKLAEAAGEIDAANEIRETASTEPVVVVPKETPKVQGLSFREDWKFTIEYPALIPPRFHRLDKNPKGEWSCKCIQDIGAEVSRLKSSAKIPGVKVWAEKTPVGRG